MTKKQYMKIAINLAIKGEGSTLKNPIVGAILVKNNKIIGKGYHKEIGQNHAEIEAINHSKLQCKKATLFVTLEPCNHKGKTPPCTNYIIKTGIKHVVFAIKDPNVLVKGNGENFLKNNKIKVTFGTCIKESIFLNESFIKYTKSKIPFITLKCASTLDGRIATYSGHSKWITRKKARKYAHKIRHKIDAILVGIKTIINDNPRLTTRLENTIGFENIKVILDTNLSIEKTSKIIGEKSCKKTYIFTKKKISIKKKKQIENNSVKVLQLESEKKRILIKDVFKKLGILGVKNLLIEGGGKTIGSALESKLADKILFFFAPKILSSKYGISSCEGTNKKSIKQCINMCKISVKKLDIDILIEAYIKNETSLICNP